MRVGLNVEQLLYRAPGGIGKYTAKLAELLPRLFPEDTIVTFAARHSEPETDQAYRRFGLDTAGLSPPVRVRMPRALLYESWHTVGMPRLGWLSPALRGLDVVHAPSVAVPPEDRRARLVVTIHDLAPLLFPETFPPRGRRFHIQGIRAAARRAALVITVSEAASAEILEHTSIPAERLRVVPNGVDLLQADQDTVAETLARRGLSGVPYVLWVGSLEPRKNVGVLVAAFARLLAAEPELPHRLVLAGPLGWLHDGLLPAAEVAALGDRLLRPGRVSETELRALYAGAELFAFPSRHEGFGLPVLEAMAQGTPVLCADIPALVEVSGGAARLAKGNELDAWVAALSELVHDPAARAALSQAGRRRAAQFSWERSVRATRAVYEAALAP